MSRLIKTEVYSKQSRRIYPERSRRTKTGTPTSLDARHKVVPGNYYDRAIQHNILQRFWHSRRFGESRKILAGLKAQKILDVGCHGGRFTYEISKLFPQALIYGIDISFAAIEFARKKYQKFHFIVAKAENLPFADNTFDLVTCLEVLEHVQNPQLVIRGIYRVLKPNGTLVVLVPTENILFRIIWRLWTKFGPGRVWSHTHVHQLQDQTIRDLLDKEGFKIDEKKDFLFQMLTFIKARNLK